MEFHVNISEHDPNIRQAVELFGSMLPINTFVLARNYREFLDFCRVIRKKLKYSEYPEYFLGLENFVVVRLGFYAEHPRFEEIRRVLMSRRGVVYITVPDWR